MAVEKKDYKEAYEQTKKIVTKMELELEVAREQLAYLDKKSK